MQRRSACSPHDPPKTGAVWASVCWQHDHRQAHAGRYRRRRQAPRESMLERQCDGIAKGKREGHYKGRVPTVRRQAAEIIRLKEEGVRIAEIGRKLGIGRASI